MGLYHHDLEKPVLVVGTEELCADFIKRYEPVMPDDVVLINGAQEHGATDVNRFAVAIDEYPDDFSGYSGVISLVNPQKPLNASRIYNRYLGLPALAVDTTNSIPSYWSAQPASQRFLKSLSHITIRLTKPIALTTQFLVTDKDSQILFPVEAQHVLCHSIATENNLDARAQLSKWVGDFSPRRVVSSRNMAANRASVIQYLSQEIGLSPTQVASIAETTPQNIHRYIKRTDIEQKTKDLRRRAFGCEVGVTKSFSRALQDLVEAEADEITLCCFLSENLGNLELGNQRYPTLQREAAATASYVTTDARVLSIGLTLGITPPALPTFFKVADKLRSKRVETDLSEKFARVAEEAGKTASGNPVITKAEVAKIAGQEQYIHQVTAERIAARLRNIWERFEDGKLAVPQETDIHTAFIQFASDHMKTLSRKTPTQAQNWLAEQEARAMRRAVSQTRKPRRVNARGGS